MAKLIAAVLVSAAMLAAVTVDARAACLPYEPASVTLTGRLAPASHAVAAQSLRLVLDRPACTAAGAGAAGEARLVSVGLVFLLGAGRVRDLIGRRVAVSGSLFHAAGPRADGPVMLTVAGVGRAH